MGGRGYFVGRSPEHGARADRDETERGEDDLRGYEGQEAYHGDGGVEADLVAWCGFSSLPGAPSISRRSRAGGRWLRVRMTATIWGMERSEKMSEGSARRKKRGQG